jgi:hypothetical protein
MLALCGVEGSDEHNNCHMKVSKQAILSHKTEKGKKSPSAVRETYLIKD